MNKNREYQTWVVYTLLYKENLVIFGACDEGWLSSYSFFSANLNPVVLEYKKEYYILCSE